MVIIRPGRIEQHKQQHKQQRQQSQVFQERMFKVPANSPPPPPPTSSTSQAQVGMAGKRKWQEAFKAESCPSGMPAPQHRSPQLTIFYAGAVNVYDNVPENMVRALMTLAAAKSSKPAALVNQVELQRSSSSNVKNPGFGFLGNQSSSNGSSQLNSSSARPAIKSSNNIATGSNNSASFSFPVLETASTSLSLNSSFKPASEERPSLPAPAPAPAPVPAPAQAAVPVAAPAPAPAPVPDQSAQTSSPSPVPRSMRMQMLPAGLPQARRASIQRFLQKRKQKQVINGTSEDDDDGAVAATAEMKPTYDAASPSTRPASTSHVAAQVPHFLKQL